MPEIIKAAADPIMQNQKMSTVDNNNDVNEGTEVNYWLDRIEAWNQQHLLEATSSEASRADSSKPSRLNLFKQLEVLDSAYPGGLSNYIERSVKLLRQSKNGVNPFCGFVPTLPDRTVLKTESAEFAEVERLGLSSVGQLAFVLVAGGLGERLGYSDVKINLPIETSTGMTYLQYYVKLIIACQNIAEKHNTTGKPIKLPLSIMTSDETHQRTEEILRLNRNYGLDDEQVTLMKQVSFPALLDNQARFATVPNDPFTIETKPHGHGDVHQLLHQLGQPLKWLSEGLKWMVVFQDTNGLFSHAICPMLGVSIQNEYVMNSLAVARRTGEPVGAICKLVRKVNADKENENAAVYKDLTINIEYNQLSCLLSENEEAKYLDFPGNANVLLFKLDRYAEVLNDTGGNVPEFINPKYADETRETFKSPTRIESLMQEFPRLLMKSTREDKVGVTQLDRWLCFSTVKNNATAAAAKVKAGEVAESAFTGESDEYFCYSKMLEIAAAAKCCKVEIAVPKPVTFLDVAYRLGPRVVMLPSFAFTMEQIKQRIVEDGFIQISDRSTLILDGNIEIDGLILDGALILRSDDAVNGKLLVGNLHIQNSGWEFIEIDTNSMNVSSSSLIRGYTIIVHDTTSIINATSK